MRSIYISNYRYPSSRKFKKILCFEESESCNIDDHYNQHQRCYKFSSRPCDTQHSTSQPQRPINKNINKFAGKMHFQLQLIKLIHHSGLKLHIKYKNQKPWKSPWKILSFMSLKNICIIKHQILISPYTRGIKNCHLENRTI